MAARPKPDARLTEALKRLRFNQDFVALQAHLQSDLAYTKDRLVTEAEPGSFRELQGRARQLQDILELIPKE